MTPSEPVRCINCGKPVLGHHPVNATERNIRNACWGDLTPDGIARAFFPDYSYPALKFTGPSTLREVRDV